MTNSAALPAKHDLRMTEQFPDRLGPPKAKHDGLHRGIVAKPSPEALAVAEDLTFEAVGRACARLAGLANGAWEAAESRDARGAAVRLRQAIATLRAACEVAAMLAPSEGGAS
jgi:hypothetical protein